MLLSVFSEESIETFHTFLEDVVEHFYYKLDHSQKTWLFSQKDILESAASHDLLVMILQKERRSLGFAIELRLSSRLKFLDQPKNVLENGTKSDLEGSLIRKLQRIDLRKGIINF